MNHQTFFHKRNLLGFLLYLILFKDSYPHFFLHSYLKNIVIVISCEQKYYPDVTIKTDITRNKIPSKKDNNMATIIRQSYIDKIEKYLQLRETIIVLVGQRIV